jgi:hypothetical protein
VVDQPDSELDTTEIANQLLKKGQSQGYIDYNEINEAIPETEANLESLDQLHADLIDTGVEIINKKGSSWEEADEELLEDQTFDDNSDDSVR